VIGEMASFKQVLASAVGQRYGSVCMFEHGPSRENSLVGCGVDHAHLHIVPLKFDLFSSVKPFMPPDVLWSQASFAECQTEYAKGRDYLYLEQPTGAGRIATHASFGSQLFRRAIARRLGMEDRFDWRIYPQVSNVLATVEEVTTWRVQRLNLRQNKTQAAA
jgi:ATP adenylyltransferase